MSRPDMRVVLRASEAGPVQEPGQGLGQVGARTYERILHAAAVALDQHSRTHMYLQFPLDCLPWLTSSWHTHVISSH